MTEGDWERAVREQVGLGRLLPLGAADDGAWIAERAAAGALRRAAADVRGARVTGLRVGLDGDVEDAGGRAGPGVGPAPVSALPYGELRISAECDAAVDRPMTATAEALREALLRGAEELLGLRVTAVDVHVAGLLETPQPAARPDPPEQGTGTGGSDVPGLLDIDTLPDGDHAELRVVVDSAHRALDVARAVRARADAATVTVLVTDIR